MAEKLLEKRNARGEHKDEEAKVWQEKPLRKQNAQQKARVDTLANYMSHMIKGAIERADKEERENGELDAIVAGEDEPSEPVLSEQSFDFDDLEENSPNLPFS